MAALGQRMSQVSAARSPFKPRISTQHSSRLSICFRCALRHQIQARAASSGSRWKQRQSRDPYARDAKVQGLKSRAAFKLLEMDEKYRLFRNGQTVVDLVCGSDAHVLLAGETLTYDYRDTRREAGLKCVKAIPADS